MTDLTPTVIKAFFHRTRKLFVPMTSDELARKIKADPDKVAMTLWSLGRVGNAAVFKSKGNSEPSTWHLTNAGQAEARALMTAEAFVKGGNA